MPFIRHFLSVLLCSLGLVVLGQQAEFCGKVTDTNGLPLVGVSVYDSLTVKGTTTDEQGMFCLAVDSSPRTVVISFIGMTTQYLHMDGSGAEELTIRMEVSSASAGEVTITDRRNLMPALSDAAAKTSVTAETIEALPEFLGDADPVRAMQFSSGISSSTEGLSGLIVRGGSIDQNLFLIDNAVVYNPTHLSGLFSVVNADIMESAEIYKGVLPARFGGRGSSVIDLGLKRGVMDSTLVKGNIGLLTTKLYASTPIIKNKLAIQASVRKTYIDELVSLFRDDTADDFVDAGYGFRDGTAKITWLPSEKDLVTLTGHHNQDQFRLSTEGGILSNDMKWSNNVAALNHSRFVSSKLIWKSYAAYSGYDFGFDAGLNAFSLSVASAIQDWSGGTEINWTLDSAKTFVAGLHVVHHDFLPNDKAVIGTDGRFDFSDDQHIVSQEVRPYLGWKQKVRKDWLYDIGLHGTGYWQKGPFNYYERGSLNHVSDTIISEKSDRFNAHYKISPRLQVAYQLTDSSILSVGVSRNYQMVHMASISSISFPADFWFPTTYGIPPQEVDQVSIEYRKSLFNQRFTATGGAYYKRMANLIEYQFGMLGNFDSYNLDDDIIIGNGTAYGVEAELSKNTGKVTGKVSYTYSRTLRQFDAINSGAAYPAKYDHPHDFSCYVFYKWRPRISLSGTFVYTSGNNMTVPASRYIIQEGLINTYNPKNGFRMPAYHRADVGISIVNKPEKRFKSTWKFSVYNVYNRPNPFLVYFTANGDLAALRLRVRAKQVTLFPLLPSISWKFEF